MLTTNFSPRCFFFIFSYFVLFRFRSHVEFLLSTLALHLFSICFGYWSAFRLEQVVCPSERAGVVANEKMMVFIMMVCTCPERKEVVQRPWELVTRVGVNSLEQPQADPDRNGEQMQVSGEVAPDNRNANSTQA